MEDSSLILPVGMVISNEHKVKCNASWACLSVTGLTI